MDLLKMPPKGSWKPSLNISTLLKSIQILMSNPNPEDPLMEDIAREFSDDKRSFLEKAKMWTAKYATNENSMSCGKRKHNDEKSGEDCSKVLKEAN